MTGPLGKSAPGPGSGLGLPDGMVADPEGVVGGVAVNDCVGRPGGRGEGWEPLLSPEVQTTRTATAVVTRTSGTAMRGERKPQRRCPHHRVLRVLACLSAGLGGL